MRMPWLSFEFNCQHLFPMRDRFLHSVTVGQQLGQRRACPHVRPRLVSRPEMSAQFAESARVQCSLRGLQRLANKYLPFGGRLRFLFGEQEPRVCAVFTDRQRLSRQFHAFSSGRTIQRPEKNLLCSLECGSVAARPELLPVKRAPGELCLHKRVRFVERLEILARQHSAERAVQSIHLPVIHRRKIGFLSAALILFLMPCAHATGWLNSARLSPESRI
jgi:hypothetical protein